MSILFLSIIKYKRFTICAILTIVILIIILAHVYFNEAPADAAHDATFMLTTSPNENGSSRYVTKCKTIIPRTMLLGNLLVRVDNELVVDCYYSNNGYHWGVFAISDLGELHDVVKLGNKCFDVYEDRFYDREQHDRTYELSFRSDKSYVDIDSIYTKKLPKEARYPIIDVIRANSSKCAVVYIPLCVDESDESWLLKENATLEVWSEDKHCTISTWYPNQESRRQHYHGIDPASYIFLLDDSVVLMILGYNRVQIVVTDCITTNSLQDNVRVDNRDTQIESDMMHMLCDDGKFIYIAYKDKTTDYNDNEYVIVRNNSQGIIESSEWDEVMRVQCNTVTPIMEWYDNCLVFLDGREIHVCELMDVQ